MKRHNGRIIAVQILYNMDIRRLTKEETIQAFEDLINLEKEEEYPVEIDTKYAQELIEGCYDNINNIDMLISSALTNYTIDRLSYVDRAIIRIAVYEMKWLKVDKHIAINAALEITREYSSIDNDKQVQFNNKLLDKVSIHVNEQ